jgi:hypothetical protein
MELREICAKTSPRHVFGILLPGALIFITALASLNLTVDVYIYFPEMHNRSHV